MLAPDEVASMVRLHQLGWGTQERPRLSGMMLQRSPSCCSRAAMAACRGNGLGGVMMWLNRPRR